MEINVLGSGSSGNSYYFPVGDVLNFVDVGVPRSALKPLLDLKKPQQINIFLTHEHQDHIRGLRSLQLMFPSIPMVVYASAPVLEFLHGVESLHRFWASEMLAPYVIEPERLYSIPMENASVENASVENASGGMSSNGMSSNGMSSNGMSGWIVGEASQGGVYINVQTVRVMHNSPLGLAFRFDIPVNGNAGDGNADAGDAGDGNVNGNADAADGNADAGDGNADAGDADVNGNADAGDADGNGNADAVDYFRKGEVFGRGERVVSIGFLSDTGCTTSEMLDTYRRCRILFMEANYDESLLEKSAYPRSIKDRISSSAGHLSNAQGLQFIEGLSVAGCVRLLGLIHVSENANSYDLLESYSKFYQSTYNINTLVLRQKTFRKIIIK